jgi:hypothetical protein
MLKNFWSDLQAMQSGTPMNTIQWNSVLTNLALSQKTIKLEFGGRMVFLPWFNVIFNFLWGWLVFFNFLEQLNYWKTLKKKGIASTLEHLCNFSFFLFKLNYLINFGFKISKIIIHEYLSFFHDIFFCQC